MMINCPQLGWRAFKGAAYGGVEAEGAWGKEADERGADGIAFVASVLGDLKAEVI